jgi:hypothetical protein
LLARAQAVNPSAPAGRAAVHRLHNITARQRRARKLLAEARSLIEGRAA